MRSNVERDASSFRVRPAVVTDVPALLPLMRGLAEYEGYADRFAVTEETLVSAGFAKTPPDFECLVAETDSGSLAGMLVYYMIPFTFTTKPTLFVKELYVDAEWRSSGVGSAIMRAAAAEAVRRNCGLMKWQVARWNADAARFYRRLGAKDDPEWVDFSLTLAACAALGEDRA